MVGWHHRLNGHEFEQTPRDSEGQGSPWGCKESDTWHLATEQQQQQSIQKILNGLMEGWMNEDVN